MKYLLGFISLLFCILYFTIDQSYAQVVNNKKQNNTANVAKPKSAPAAKKTQSNYDKIINTKHTTFTGLWTIHKFRTKIYFEIPLSLMGRDFLLASTVSSSSDNTNAISGQKIRKPIHFQYKIENHNLLMVLPGDNLLNSDDQNIENALANSNLKPVFKSFKVITYNPEKTNVVVDATDLFTGDQKEISPFDNRSKSTYYGKAHRTTKIQKDECYIKEVKAFEDNISIRSVLSYKNTMKYAGSTVYENRPFLADVTRTILLLPEDVMMSRYADPRIGIFSHYKKQYTSDAIGAETKYFTNRWRLEPKDPKAWKKGKLVEPKKPIIFYIDSNYPESWKKYVKLGVEDWQKAFEAIGFKNAVIAKDFPTKKEDPNFDPDNLKYSCLRYSPVAIANSMGPSWIDPRSGEIINASVYSYHNVVKLLRNWMFVQTAQCDKNIRKKVMDKKIFGNALRYIIAHEIGHCLGFKHNMSASAAIPTESLRSASFTKKYGTTYSIMDYARFNYVAQPGDMKKGVKMTPPRIGLYDYYTVKWLYTPILKAKTSEEELETLNKWIFEKSGNPIYRYGKQQLYYDYDPSSLIEDLGDDVIKSSNYGIKNLKYILKNLNVWLKEEDKDMSFRNEIYVNVLKQYQQYLKHVVANVGGVYLNEVFEGDALVKCSPVDKAKQREALSFLLNEIVSNDWIEDTLVKNFLNFNLPVKDKLNVNIYYSLLSRIKNVKLAYLKSFSTNTSYSPKQYMDDIYLFTWKPIIKGTMISEKSKIYQTVFVDYLIKQSDLLSSGKGKTKSIVGITDGIYYPEELQKEIDNISCFEEISFNTIGYKYQKPLHLNKIIIAPTFYFEYLEKVKQLLLKNIETASGASKAHYKFLLTRINKALK